MKKITVFALCLAILMQVTVLALDKESIEAASQLSSRDIASLNAIDERLKEIPELSDLKQYGLLEAYVDELNSVKSAYVENTISNTMSEVESWGLRGQDTVAEIKSKAQLFLEANYDGMKIGSAEWDEMTKLYIETDYPTNKLSQEDSGFGAMFAYMCVYYDHIMNNDATKSRSHDGAAIDSLTLYDIAAEVAETEFIATEARTILGNQLRAAAASVYPSLSGSKIVAYARKYALSENTNYHRFSGNDADCTNFVSQALLDGGLPMTALANGNDNTANGVVNTNARWFYFNNSSTKGYAASGAFVRVVGLWDYLSPNYGTYTTSSSTNMPPYLQAGFVLQGKSSGLLGSWHHSVIVTGSSSAWTYCGHDSDRKDYAISNFWNGFASYRVIQTF